MLLNIRSVCPACQNNKFKKLYSLSYGEKQIVNFLESYYKEKISIGSLKNHNYTLLECKNCNLIFQQEIPTNEFSQQLYEQIIDKEFSLSKKKDFEKKFYKKLYYESNLIKGLINKKVEEISILEFGAGWGYWSNYFKNKGFNVSAYEISETRINFMKKNQISVISKINDFTKKFDFIYSEETFEHINDPKETLLILSKILNDEGFILLRFPSNFLFKSKLNKKYVPRADCAHPLEHINLFKLKSFKEMIKDMNLEVISLKSKYNFSIKNILKDFKNIFYFDSVLIKKNVK